MLININLRHNTLIRNWFILLTSERILLQWLELQRSQTDNVLRLELVEGRSSCRRTQMCNRSVPGPIVTNLRARETPRIAQPLHRQSEEFRVPSVDPNRAVEQPKFQIFQPHHRQSEVFQFHSEFRSFPEKLGLRNWDDF